MRLVALLAFETVFLLTSAGAGAFTVMTDGGSGKMVWGSGTITWYLHSAGSQDVTFDQLKNAVTAAFQAWKGVSCFSKTFSYGGTKSSDPKTGVFIQFKESNWDPTVGDAAAYAQSWTDYSGKITHSVVVFNGVDLTWTTTEANDYFATKSDIQGVATHELGHCLGLDHSRYREATMFFSGSTADLRTLEPDDKDGLTYLYCNFTQGKPCDSCSSDGNCQSGYCLEYPDNGLYCGKNCTTDANCPENFYCYDLESIQDQCASVNGYCSQAGSNIPDGQFCYGHETCKSGLCLVVPDNAYCSRECTGNAQCLSPMKCIGGLCMKGGSTPLGGDCQYHGDCQSGMCIGISDTQAVCTVACDEPKDCPSGFGCVMDVCLETGGKKYGAACDFDMECDTGLCLSPGAGYKDKICSQSCKSASNCPGGDPCTYGFCMPPGDLAFGKPCKLHTDCASGLCEGGSQKYCSKFCDDNDDCPSGAQCGSSGYCIKKLVTDPCAAGCPEGTFCKREEKGAPGQCVPECNPYSDAGCAEGLVCQWLYMSWEEQVRGECVAPNGGGVEGDSCLPDTAPCLQELVCVNVGGTGHTCYRDCKTSTGIGCLSFEACLPLGMASDPLHGVCVCNDPSCMPVVEEPAPQEEVVSQPDVPFHPPDEVLAEEIPPPKDVSTPGSKDAVDGDEDTPPPQSSGGCSSFQRTSPHATSVLLLALAILGALVRPRRGCRSRP